MDVKFLFKWAQPATSTHYIIASQPVNIPPTARPTHLQLVGHQSHHIRRHPQLHIRHVQDHVLQRRLLRHLVAGNHIAGLEDRDSHLLATRHRRRHCCRADGHVGVGAGENGRRRRERAGACALVARATAAGRPGRRGTALAAEDRRERGAAGGSGGSCGVTRCCAVVGGVVLQDLGLRLDGQAAQLKGEGGLGGVLVGFGWVE
jgi:hypothetical protein